MQTFENNPMNEQQLEELLRKAFLKQEEEAAQTQKLNAMTSTIIFNNQHFEAEASAHETRFIKGLTRSMNIRNWYWGAGLSAIIISFIAALYFFGIKGGEMQKAAKQHFLTPTVQNGQSDLPEQKTTAESANLSSPDLKQKDEVPVPGNAIDSSRTIISATDTNSFSSVKTPAIAWPEVRLTSIPNTTEEDFPVFTPAEIAQNEKRKQKMIKSILKLDAKEWCTVYSAKKMSFKGASYEGTSFIMSAMEVSNIEYKTFLIDLIVQGKRAEYLKSKVDASQWTKIGLPFLTRNYFYSKVYDDHPVVNIPREGAETYCKWLTDEVAKTKSANSKRTDPIVERFGALPQIGLPTDVAWAVAAKSGNDSTLFADGLNVIENLRGCELANYKLITGPSRHTVNTKKMAKVNERMSNYIAQDSTQIIPGKDKYCGTIDSSNYYTVSVFSFNPNNYGVYCMAGNAAEMVWVGKNQTAGTMGGSWNSTKTHLLIEGKDEYEGITGPSPFIGFRPVMTFMSNKK
jgi:formylglycine-generating enzyme required for sulfatase activity